MPLSGLCMVFHVCVGFIQTLHDMSALSKIGGALSRVPWNYERSQWQAQREEEGALHFFCFGQQFVSRSGIWGWALGGRLRPRPTWMRRRMTRHMWRWVGRSSPGQDCGRHLGLPPSQLPYNSGPGRVSCSSLHRSGGPWPLELASQPHCLFSTGLNFVGVWMMLSLLWGLLGTGWPWPVAVCQFELIQWTQWAPKHKGRSVS